MREIPRRPVTEPAAWTSAELAGDDSWIHLLDRAELAELDDATKAVRRRGLTAPVFARDDFPLPILGRRIERILHELEFGRGCVLVRGLDAGRYDMETLETLYWGLGVHLGTPISQNARGDLLGHVRDRGRDYYSKNVRGYTTSAGIKPHCDSSDIVTLLCAQPAGSGGASMIASGLTIHNEILAHHPEYLESLHGGFHFDLRGEGATGDGNEVTRNRVPVYSYYDGRLSCRYNCKTIEDGQKKAGRPLAGIDLEAVRLVGELAMRPDIRFDMAFEPGDIQLLNNHMMLHSRSAFEDHPEPERRRDLLRLWINVANVRALAPEFADRLNTGPRGGVRVMPHA